MAIFTRHKGALRRRGLLWTAFLLVGLISATVWDADGNPNTENLSQATVTLAPRTVQFADEQTEGDDEDESSVGLGPRLHQPRLRLRLFLGKRCWRRLAPPSRGPPGERCDGRA